MTREELAARLYVEAADLLVTEGMFSKITDKVSQGVKNANTKLSEWEQERLRKRAKNHDINDERRARMNENIKNFGNKFDDVATAAVKKAQQVGSKAVKAAAPMGVKSANALQKADQKFNDWAHKTGKKLDAKIDDAAHKVGVKYDKARDNYWAWARKTDDRINAYGKKVGKNAKDAAMRLGRKGIDAAHKGSQGFLSRLKAWFNKHRGVNESFDEFLDSAETRAIELYESGDYKELRDYMETIVESVDILQSSGEYYNESESISDSI